MKHKVRALSHLNQKDRTMVLQWCRDYEEELTRLRHKCRDYETEVSYLKRQSEMSGIVEVKDDAPLMCRVVADVTAALKRANSCHLFYSILGKFKVLTNPDRITREQSVLVGVYESDFNREQLIGEVECTLKHAKETVVL